MTDTPQAATVTTLRESVEVDGQIVELTRRHGGEDLWYLSAQNHYGQRGAHSLEVTINGHGEAVRAAAEAARILSANTKAVDRAMLSLERGLAVIRDRYPQPEKP